VHGIWGSPEEERGLIQRLTVGDHEAFETLFQRYFTTVYRQAMRRSGQQAEAEADALLERDGRQWRRIDT
jgi:DNA-directed RNA polymerase specialized sigma24 family protein